MTTAKPSAETTALLAELTTAKPSTKSSAKPTAKSSAKSYTSGREVPTQKEDDEDAAFRQLTGVGKRLHKTFELTQEMAEAPMSNYYTTGADPNAVLNMEFEKFRKRIKRNLFRLQPVCSLRPEGEPLLKDLFDIIYSFLRGNKTKNLDQLLTVIGHPGLSEDDVRQKGALGDVLVKLIDYNETGTYAVPLLLPIFIDNLFKGEELKLPAVSMTYFIINESLPIENSTAVLRLIAHLAELPKEFLDALDKGFRFTSSVLDNIKQLV